MKIVTVVGARPQFIKSAAISRAIQRFNNGGNPQRIVGAVHGVLKPQRVTTMGKGGGIYGDGNASDKIITILLGRISREHG